MRVAISGKSGCGNTTVSTIVAKTMNYQLINYTFRMMADERNIDFWTFCAMAEQDDSIDLELDKKQVEMAMATKDCVLGSRLAIWMLKEADLKVYLTATDTVRAKRIQKREGGTFQQRLEETQIRDSNDTSRYKRLYNIDNNDTNVADLVIETDNLKAEEVAKIIVDKIKQQLTKD
jgi:cytidylate kinase